ncbi:hypothetical protein TSUD_186890 [Trifolium subterraneum]|uniref:Reverse transcriptase domain-containing protein n=1 Tax=Trifolium subterraneum TaxID=3900 RepID=A0A2Z6NYY2_TRISU|nr:hypothetical protein TSUD_186890 [Trifolium subterraneum]
MEWFCSQGKIKDDKGKFAVLTLESYFEHKKQNSGSKKSVGNFGCHWGKPQVGGGGGDRATHIVDGAAFEGVDEVRHIVYHHFKNHFQRKLHSRPDIGGLLFKSISTMEGADLVKPFLIDEINAAVWDCESFKSPGPDGINLAFFKDFWDVLKIDLLNFFAEFHRNGKLTKGLNSTFIPLIPKVESPQRMADFRPIALSALIKSRQILDGILIAKEIVDDAKKNKKYLILFKVDFEKAYDSVDWGYLEEVMAKMNFPVVWRAWIMECVTFATALVLVNGSPTDEFCFERGLRQGDPLSPFLFLLAAEGLNVMMSALVSNKIFTPYGIGPQNSVHVSHLQFADDTLLVGIKSWVNVRALKAVLILFEAISGLKVNFNKSMLFGVNVNDSWLHEAASVMHCKHGRLPFLYLGLPIGGDPQKLQFWQMGVEAVGGEGEFLECGALCEVRSGGGRIRFEGGVGSIWWRTLNQIRSGTWLVDARWLVDNIIRKIGDGQSVLFWMDPWVGECPLARMAWLTGGFGSFIRPSASRLNAGLDCFLWLKPVPLKVNIFVCRLFFNRLPTKDNLHKRGVLDSTQLLCATSCGKVEDRDHLFFQCEVYGRIWLLVSKWLGFDSIFNGTTVRGLGGASNSSKTAFTIIWISVLFVSWKDRNRRIFQSGSDMLETLTEKVKLQTFGG